MVKTIYNILRINAGSDFSKSFDILALNGSPFELTDWIPTCQFRKDYTSRSAVSATCSKTSDQITIELSSEQTFELDKWSYVFDIQISNSSTGMTLKPINGVAYIDNGVTR